MATINRLGSITAHCPGCQGALSTYEWRNNGAEFGHVPLPLPVRLKHGISASAEHRLYRCAGCGRGGLALIYVEDRGFPSTRFELREFHREVRASLKIPEAVPDGIAREFREAEKCLSNECYRAAAGMFRSALDKTMRANGYKLKPLRRQESALESLGRDRPLPLHLHPVARADARPVDAVGRRGLPACGRLLRQQLSAVSTSRRAIMRSRGKRERENAPQAPLRCL